MLVTIEGRHDHDDYDFGLQERIVKIVEVHVDVGETYTISVRMARVDATIYYVDRLDSMHS